MNFEDKYSMSREDSVFWAKRNIVDSIYREAKLEGVGATYPDTYQLLQGRSVAGLDLMDIFVIVDLKNGWKHILSHLDDTPDLDFIKRLHSVIGTKTGIEWRGNLRDDIVGVGGTDWKPAIPDEKLCRKEIDEILNRDVTPTEKALDLMLYICRRQMFWDGNKRLAQLVANHFLIKNGVGTFSVPEHEFGTFLKKLVSYYETNEPDNLKRWLYDNCIDGTAIPIQDRKKQEKARNNDCR